MTEHVSLTARTLIYGIPTLKDTRRRLAKLAKVAPDNAQIHLDERHNESSRVVNVEIRAEWSEWV